VAHERPDLYITNGDHSAAGGTRNNQRGAAAVRRVRSKDRGGEGTAGTKYVHGRVADRGWSGWLCSGVESGGI